MVDLSKLDIEAPAGDFSTSDSAVAVPFIESIPKNGVYLEIGVNKGKSLYIARQVADKSVKVYGVDVRKDPKVEGTIFWQQDSKLGPPEKIEIDVLFIDGDHTYEGCKADIDAWTPYVKPGGTVIFHDADEGGPGILRAITEYIDTGQRLIFRWTLHKVLDRSTSMVSVQYAS
jgi:hypothetical protein